MHRGEEIPTLPRPPGGPDGCRVGSVVMGPGPALTPAEVDPRMGPNPGIGYPIPAGKGTSLSYGSLSQDSLDRSTPDRLPQEPLQGMEVSSVGKISPGEASRPRQHAVLPIHLGSMPNHSNHRNSGAYPTRRGFLHEVAPSLAFGPLSIDTWI